MTRPLAGDSQVVERGPVVVDPAFVERFPDILFLNGGPGRDSSIQGQVRDT